MQVARSAEAQTGLLAAGAGRTPTFLMGLREDGDERKGSFLLADGLREAPLGLFFAVIASGAGAVQEEDDGIDLLVVVDAVVLGNEDDVLGVAVFAFGRSRRVVTAASCQLHAASAPIGRMPYGVRPTRNAGSGPRLRTLCTNSWRAGT